MDAKTKEEFETDLTLADAVEYILGHLEDVLAAGGWADEAGRKAVLADALNKYADMAVSAFPPIRNEVIRAAIRRTTYPGTQGDRSTGYYLKQYLIWEVKAVWRIESKFF